MLKVILVDDEALVKIGIKSLINSSETGFQIVGEGSDGESGLALIREHRPDLVITDIVMPRMNGIEMMAKAKAYCPNTVFVVLSSYDEFDLVKKAMKLGAWDYLLKLNINAEAISEILLSIRETIYTERKKLKNIPETKSIDVRSTAIMRQEFLKSILENEFENRKYIDAKLSMLKMELNEEGLMVGMIRTNLYINNGKYSDEDVKLLDFMITEILSEIGNEFFSSYFFKWSFGVYVMVFSPDSLAEWSENREKIQSMSQIMIEMIKKYVNIELAISFSEPHSDYLKLPAAFRQAQKSMERLFYAGFDSILFHSDAGSDITSDEHIIDLHFGVDVPKAIEIHDIKTIENMFDALMEDIRTKRIVRDEICQTCNQLFYLCDVFLGDKWNEYALNCPEGPIKADTVMEMQTCGEMMDWLENYKRKIVDFLSREKVDEKHILVYRAKKYILEHIMSTLGLKDVAAQLNISPGYLSSIFTKHTGMCFTDYVNKEKIGEAQKLIKDGKHKIYEISYMLGFENACYFSKIFKRITGCSPSEFLKIAGNS